MSEILPPIMSVGRAAEHLNVSRATMYNWCKAGIVPSIKIGNTRRIKRDSLLEWINRNEVGTSEVI